VNYITNAKGMYCLLDLHNYHRYRGNVIGSAAVPYAALTDVWQKLATLYKNNGRMVWGTMNEPYGVGYLAAQLGANAAIKGIRNAGATVRPSPSKPVILNNLTKPPRDNSN
jgi:endoglucanase